MRRALAIALVASACGNDVRPPIDGEGETVPFTECDGDAASFVRQAFLALAGRRPISQAEVDVYVDLYDAVAAAEGDPEDAVARAIMKGPEFTERWVDTFMDAMRVQRLDIQNEAMCWDDILRPTIDGALAAAVRIGAATSPGDGKGAWTMLDLARSSIALDDVTPLYRAQLFSMVAHPIPAANVPPREAELARRADFGDTFDSAYLNRDIVCLGCHTSDRAVTDHSDPEIDRHWPVPGLPERVVFGVTALEPDRAHGAFRVDDFVGEGSSRPWGWSTDCGTFASPASVSEDIAGIDTKLASVTGTRATVYSLEAALGRGFDKLRGQPPPIGDTGAIDDPDTALAWLVTLKMTEDVWKRVTGTPLTIANYFPRNAAASDLLYALASRYSESGYSLRALLVAIVSSDYFNRQPPEAGCGESPYTYPPVFDPWVISELDRERRGNGPGDAITAVDARTLVSATAAALEWTAPPAASRFPDYGDTGCEDLTCSNMENYCEQAGACCTSHHAFCVMNGADPANQLAFERGVGMFLRNSEAGFRGLDFQARLVWEERYGACTKPTWVGTDFLDDLVMTASVDPAATVADVVSAVKDRLIGEPKLVDPAERAALEALFGPLDARASTDIEPALRQLCGALLGSPQFMLQGMAGRGGDHPKLTPAGAGYDAVCGELAMRIGVTCTGGKLALPAPSP